MILVPDASVVVAAFIDAGPVGKWALDALGVGHLAAPHLMPVEVSSVLRRAEIGGELSPETASQAHDDLLDLSVRLFPYEPFGQRIWDLRSSVAAYDAWYVALAEELDATLLTLDARLVRAHGPRCAMATPTS